MGLGDKGCQEAGGGCLANVARGRGVLEDKQGWLLPAVLDGHSQCEWGKQWMLCLGVLGTWGAAPVVWATVGVPKSCLALAAAAMLGSITDIQVFPAELYD